MEEIVIATMGLTPNQKGSSAKVVPDAYMDNMDKTPVEIKSLGLTASKRGKSVLYDWRTEKEAWMIPNLVYMFGGYRKGKPFKRLGDLMDRVCEYGLDIAVVPSHIVHRHASLVPLNRIVTDNRRGGEYNGYTRGGYVRGYRNLDVSPYFDFDLGANLYPNQSCYGLNFILTIFRTKQ